MARDHDKQLLESVATRRERLRAAFLHGDLGSRRSTPDNVMRLVASVVLGAVACAGCAGFAFVTSHLEVRVDSLTGTSPAPASPASGPLTGTTDGVSTP
ncbi:hypothetical protein [Myceligenerans indicum]|uniref:DUF3040 domain-containing protein n=1 Tax=Myceligenerans indicum TaxID=2593663 RepID=A0ABS1LF23_9MICO|nr:hypothetical protein [Myceligenerans indicum]MBL0884840.1 hypothetical protein [Myceligenerans indicum]